MKKVKKEFRKCPCCGSKNGLIKRVIKEAVKEGLAEEDIKVSIMPVTGVIFDPRKSFLVGGKVPAYKIYTDACLDCGCIYAPLLETGEAVVTAEKPTTMQPPGSAQSRKN